ncbi:hypothetical protein ACO0RG_000512 [Hanseniaspora osmophila]|uniref:Protein VMS1 n=1 Tax=Hanseniaspora osmophila TaxID=56408 RepID=A0A1E5R2G5_9ASCO|nr:Protein VMS1 [Hanseniaspora osmophila]
MTDNFKKEELYIFDLSKNVSDSLELMYFNEEDVEVSAETVVPKPSASQKHSASPIRQRNEIEPAVSRSSTACSVCKADIDSRDHYKTDFHRFNLKREVKNLPTLNETEFQDLFSQENDSEESISGSEDEYSDEESGSTQNDLYQKDNDELTTIFEHSIQSLQISEKPDESASRGSYMNTRSPFIFLKSNLLQEDKIFGAYKSLFNAASNPIDEMSGELKKPNSSAIFMIGGGHFAGAIISHTRLKNITFNKKIDLSLNEQLVNILHHKTFHRYTTRRKQGGSQSAMDNAKGKANSAGSSLRRYNETALKQDIEKLLNDWKIYLQDCKYIFIRANGVSNRKTLIGQHSPLKSGDPRIMNLPFTTKRPTTSELKRSWAKLSYLQILSKPQTQKKVLKEESVSKSKSDRSKNSAETELVVPESPESLQTKEVIQLLRKAKAPLLIAYLRKNKLDVNFPLQPQDQHGATTATMLHYASYHGLKNMVYILLNTLKADPTVQNTAGRVAADMTNKQDVKQAFQMARHTLGESYANWDVDAHVGPPLTREMLESMQTEKQQAESKDLKDKLEAAKKIIQQEKEEKMKNENKVGSGVPLQSNNLQQTLNSLTPEQRMRYMREQRARAAEARMSANK